MPARGGLDEVAPVLQALLPEAEACGAEVVVVGGVGPGERAPRECVRLVAEPSADMCELHRRGVEEVRGEVVAIGEDHAVPRAGWCEAVLRAHAENGDAAAVVGCLVNATDATVSGRANFLAFAAAWQPPMPELPADRPPPASTLSFKREALEAIASRPSGWLEARLIPTLFADGSMVADERIVVDHHQDQGSLWSIRNALHSARSSYGFGWQQMSPARRRELARWTIANVPRRLRAEARAGAGATRAGRLEWALIWLIAAAAGLGAAAGVLAGPGRSSERVA